MGQKGRVHGAERTALEKGLQDTLPAVGPRGAAAVYRDTAAALLNDNGISLADVKNPDAWYLTSERQETQRRGKCGTECQRPPKLFFADTPALRNFVE